MSIALVVLLIGLILAGVSAAVGVAAATVSQHELTRWVAYKLRGSPATAGVLQNPGRTIAAANMLTTLGVLLAAGALPALVSAAVPSPEGPLPAERATALRRRAHGASPFLRGPLGGVVGGAHTLDLRGRQPGAPIRVRPPLTVPGTMRAADLMLEMQRGGQHLAVVLDEFGGTAGLVTFEDLLNDLVSELFEPSSSTPDTTRVIEGEGSTPTTELAEKPGM